MHSRPTKAQLKPPATKAAAPTFAAACLCRGPTEAKVISFYGLRAASKEKEIDLAPFILARQALGLHETRREGKGTGAKAHRLATERRKFN